MTGGGSGAGLPQVIAEMRPYVEAGGFGDGFLGRATRRAGAVVSRSVASRALVEHPLLLALCRAVLGRQLLHLPTAGTGEAGGLEKWLSPGNKQFPFQLSLSQVICIGEDGRGPAGAKPQPLHRDGWGFGMDWQQQLEPEISTMWALSEFTAENGATRVAMGSHRWPASRRPTEAETAQAVMGRGGVVVYLGDCFHSGGANRTAADRWGANVDYNLALLRQEENQFLACVSS